MITLLNCCNTPHKDSINSFYADTSIFNLDTSFKNVLIEGKKFDIKVFRDKLDEHLESYNKDEFSDKTESPITIILNKSEDGKIIYIKKFDFEPNDHPYLNYAFYKGQNQPLSEPGRLYFMLNKGYGGSGSGSIRYYINIDEGKVNLSNLFESSGELSYILYGKNDNQILVLNGIWNPDDGGHFANHRYSLVLYRIRNKEFEKKEIGKTNYKYSSLDENKSAEQILSDIQKNEPTLLDDINISNFIKNSQ